MYTLIEKDTLVEAIETAFSDGRKYQSNRDEETLFARLDRAMEDNDIIPSKDERTGNTYLHGFRDSAEEIKSLIQNEFEEDAGTFSGGKELERRIACLVPETEDGPNLHPYEAQEKLARIRELLATPEMYGGESKEKIETILSILCED